jgi:hypothetical protein
MAAPTALVQRFLNTEGTQGAESDASQREGHVMKSTKLAVVTVLLFGTLSACKPEPAAPAAEAEPAAAESVDTPPPPVVPEATSPETTTPASTEPAKDAGEETDGTRPGD